MPSVIIREAGKPDRIFHITDRETLIGRGEGVDIALPHITVSREHAKITFLQDSAFIENLSLQDNLLVNSEIVKRAELKTRDKIQVGKYSLIFFGPNLSPLDQFFEGKALDDYPPYNRTSTSNKREATFHMSPDQVRSIMANDNISRNAIIVNANHTEEWTPGVKSLTIGKGGNIPTEGWLTGGIVAEISWNGNDHVIKSMGGLFSASVTINGQKLSGEDRFLNDGDVIKIGSSEFKYKLNTPD